MPRRRFSDADLERIAEMRQRGRSYGAIAPAFSCSASAISWWCLKLGADPPKPAMSWNGICGPAVMMRGAHQLRRFTAEEDALLLAMEAQGASRSAIGRALGRRHNSITGRLMVLARRDARRELAA